LEVNRTRLAIILGVSIPLLIIAGYVILNYAGATGTVRGQYNSFSVGGKTFPFTYVATNDSARAKGLMGAKITDSTTMLFVFPSSGYYSFWMYDVNSSLDIIWVDTPQGSNTGHVVFLATNSPPCTVQALCASYQPTTSADYVIEAKGGFASANGIALGTTVVIQ